MKIMLTLFVVYVHSIQYIVAHTNSPVLQQKTCLRDELFRYVGENDAYAAWHLPWRMKVSAAV